MKSYQKFTVIFLLMFSQLIYSAEQSLSANVQQEFLPYETDQYSYVVSTVELSTDDQDTMSPIVMSDVTKNNYFNSGKIRTLITKTVKDGTCITITEIWKTKNPSYLTWRNGALLFGVAVATFLTYGTLIQSGQYKVAEVENQYEQKLKKHIAMHYIDSYKKWLKTTGQAEPSLESFSKYYELMTAAHEAGHAVEQFLIDPTSWMIKATIKPEASLNAEGYVASYKHAVHDLFSVSVKNDIKRELAGDVGIMIAQEKKLKFEDFLSTKGHLMGARDIVGTDLHSAYKNAEKYTDRMHGLNSWIPQDYTKQEREQAISDLLKECYEETYQDLYAHKDEHKALTELLTKKENLYSNDIYSAVSGKKQNLLGLLSSNEQWKKYVTNLFVHEANNLVKLHENSPYEMHTIFG